MCSIYDLIETITENQSQLEWDEKPIASNDYK